LLSEQPYDWSSLFFLIYLSLSSRWRPILLKLTTPVEAPSNTSFASGSLQPPSSYDHLSPGQPLVILRRNSAHLPISCKLILFFVTPLLNAYAWVRSSWPISYLISRCHFIYRRVGLKSLRKRIRKLLRWLKVKTRVFTWFRLNIKQNKGGNGIVLEFDILLDEFYYVGFRLTWFKTGFFNYGLKTPYWRGMEIKSSHAAILFLSVNFLFFCWSGSILIIFATPFLDISGIDAPADRIRYFWDSTEFGRQMRAQFKDRITNYERMFQARRKLWVWDPHKQFMANLLRKRVDFKIEEIPTYEEKTKWGWFLDRAGKIGVFLICVGALFFFFEFCDSADMGMWTPPGPDEW